MPKAALFASIKMTDYLPQLRMGFVLFRHFFMKIQIYLLFYFMAYASPAYFTTTLLLRHGRRAY